MIIKVTLQKSEARMFFRVLEEIGESIAESKTASNPNELPEQPIEQLNCSRVPGTSRDPHALASAVIDEATRLKETTEYPLALIQMVFTLLEEIRKNTPWELLKQSRALRRWPTLRAIVREDLTGGPIG